MSIIYSNLTANGYKSIKYLYKKFLQILTNSNCTLKVTTN